MERIVTRAEAVKRRQGWYFTGKPCCRGHFARRSVSNMSCRECLREKRIKAKGESPERSMTYAEWEREHRRRQREKHEQWKREKADKRALEIAAKLLS
jgi:hypothetical protein